MAERVFLHGDQSPPYLEGRDFSAADLLFLAVVSTDVVKSQGAILGYKIKEEFVHTLEDRWDVKETGSPAPLTSDGKPTSDQEIQKVKANKIYL